MKTRHIFSPALLFASTCSIFLLLSISSTVKGQPTSKTNLNLITVKGGTFQMGCTDEQNNCESDESPVHSVTLADYQISKYEITNKQYADFMNSVGAKGNGSYNGTEYLDIDDTDCMINYTNGQFVPANNKKHIPVVEVSWFGAKAFCEYYGGRLPTEAEWEFAARGGNSETPTLYAGSNNIDEVAWFSGNSGGTIHQVGLKTPNELGIYDMTGNVWEWCNDRHDEEYYSKSPQKNPQGSSSGTFRVLRGGSFFFKGEHCRVANRAVSIPDQSYNGNGFRFVKSL